jgi:serine/threonine protein kinase
VEEKVKKSGQIVEIRKYRKEKFLGKGGFAKVYKFVDIQNQMQYAAKIISKKKITKKRHMNKVLLTSSFPKLKFINPSTINSL